MSDPTRLIDEAGEGGEGASALERDLLRAGRPTLAARERDEVWLGLSAQLAAPLAPVGKGPVVVAKAAAGAKVVGSVAAVVKGAIVVAALGGGAVVGYRALGRHAPTIVAPAPSAVSPPPAPSSEPIAPSSSPPPVVAPPQQRPRPVASVAETASHRPPASRLAAEGRVVLEARQALRDGQPEETLRRLEVARVAFGDGALAQEREALTIEALARVGRRAEAHARAAAFLRAHPESPHAAAVRSFAAP